MWTIFICTEVFGQRSKIFLIMGRTWPTLSLFVVAEQLVDCKRTHGDEGDVNARKEVEES